MSYCTTCGAALAPDARFCTACGTAVGAGTGPTMPGPFTPQAWPPPPAPPPQRQRRAGIIILCVFAGLIGLGLVAVALGSLRGGEAEPEEYGDWAARVNSGLTGSIRLLAAGTPVPPTKIEGAYSVAPTKQAPVVIVLSDGLDAAGMLSLCEAAHSIFDQVRLVGTNGAILVAARSGPCQATDAGLRAGAAAGATTGATRREEGADPAAVRCNDTKPPENPKRPTFTDSPPMTIDRAAKYTATMETSCGKITIDLDPKAAPKTVNNFVFLAKQKYFDGLTFHRVVKDFVIQGGDPQGTGTGGPGYEFEDELPHGTNVYKPGVLAMANAGPNTNGSQFFIVTGNGGLHLTNSYSVFGQVTGGLDVAQKLESFSTGDGPPTRPLYILSITITQS